MADNVAITPGSGATVAADDIGGVLHQRVKISTGEDGSATDWPTGSGNVGSTIPRVTLATDDAAIADLKSAITAGTVGTGTAGSPDADVVTVQGVASMTPIKATSGGDQYETVAASQTAQVLGATGAAGDYISGILVIPATTSPGAIALLDDSTSITVFTGGASSVSNLVPFLIPLGLLSVSGAWKLTTGANVSCIALGRFT